MKTQEANEANGYQLSPETAAVCMPAAQSDPHRLLAYSNSICAVFLLVGAVGFVQPPIVQSALKPVEEVLPAVIWEQPATEPANQQSASAESQNAAEVFEPATPAIVQPAISPSGGFELVAPVPQLIKPLAPLPSAPGIGSTPKPAREWTAGSHKDGGNYPPPDYPPRARRERLQGIVTLDIVVDPDGVATNVAVRQTSGYSDLDQSTLDWVRTKWRWPAGATRHYYWTCSYLLH